MKKIDLEVAEEVAKVATKDKMDLQTKSKVLKVLIICMCIVMCVGLFFVAGIAKYYIDENFDYLSSLVIETETVEEVI